MSKLTRPDYIKILEFYNKPIPKTMDLLKLEAEQILSSKLCKCIKKINVKDEGRSIGICTKTIFNNKGLTREKFKCKGKQMVTFKMRNSLNKKTIKKRK